MNTLKVGSLFSGVGGLDLAVESFFGAETVWHCEFDPEPSKVLAARSSVAGSPAKTSASPADVQACAPAPDRVYGLTSKLRLPRSTRAWSSSRT